MGKFNYPSDEILNPSKLQRKNYDHIILWMLANNESCEWAHFEKKPVEIPISTISRHLTKLILKGLVEKVSRGNYKITPKGEKKFHELSKERKKKRKLSYPPDLILKSGRNYSNWVLWMVYNNSFCKRSDFLEEPFSINQSSLSKSLSSLIQKGFIIKENKRYIITQSGKTEYSRILQHYNLDRQTILEEESKRIDEITTRTSQFFGKFNITDDYVKFRFLNKVLKLDYSKVKTILEDEEAFHKILLFISINHPDLYPNYISLEEFSRYYQIKKKILYFWVDEIVEGNLYNLRFFKLDAPPDKCYYFQSDEKLEKMLRAVTEEHITKNKYLEKFGESEDLKSMLNDILDEICVALFNEDLKESLRELLPSYIKYLAFKIQFKKELKETYDKLEGIIWQSMSDMMQSQNKSLKSQYKEQIKEIDKEIGLNPKNYELYNSKIRILIYFNRYKDTLVMLEKMIKEFPEKEIDIMMKKAYTLKKNKDLEAGLDIIDELINKYPNENILHNYKAYWLSYLGEKEESYNILRRLTENEPEKGIYHDTFGEILITFKEYGNAIEEFQKAIELDSDEWYIHQTYIKLGICYTAESENLELAVKYLKKGKELTNKIISDLESKNKWLAIVNLFLAEIEEQKQLLISD